MKNKILFIILLIGSYSCSKEKGCTDEQAINYNAVAKVDDASCIYPQTNTFVDERDGTLYHTMDLAGYTWIRENISYELDSIKVPGGATELKEQEGYLYAYEDAKIVCPSGYHLSTKLEWEDLIQEIDSNGLLLQESKHLNDSIFPGVYINSNDQYTFYGNIAKYWVYLDDTSFFDLSITRSDSNITISGPFTNEFSKQSVKCVKNY